MWSSRWRTFGIIIGMIGMFALADVFAQPNGPWNAPLLIAWSTDGQQFGSPTTFQDSSGVPSVVRWNGDTLVAAFQWFREPRTAPTWDRVAVKFSYDNGMTWTEPSPIVVEGLPSNFQRPFDPTLAVVDGQMRIYFSSSEGMTTGGLTEIVNTYSAIGADGIHYTFEPGARFDHPTRPVIDPAVIYFRGEWNFSAPSGAPQDGAFHAVSNDGLLFEPRAPYPSDQQHNWTGNYALVDDTTVRFYGSGQRLWYAESHDAQTWRPFVNIGVIGGDPAALKIDDQRWLMIYVGPRYITSVTEGRRTSDAERVSSDAGRWTIDVLGRRTQNASGPGLYIEVVVDPDGSVTLRKFIAEY